MPRIEVVIEVVLVLWAVAGAAVSLTNRGHAARVGFAAACAMLVLAQLRIVGFHWQIAPAYLALLLAAALLWKPLAFRLRAAFAVAAMLLACTSLAALWVLPLFSLPRPTGEFAVGTSGPLHWTDTSRNLQGAASDSGPRRELELQIWYPAATVAGGVRARYAVRQELGLARSYEAVIRTNSLLDAPIAGGGSALPVLLFHHRWGGSRTQDTFLLEELASHGYVVVALDHPLNAARVRMQDGSVVESDRADALSNVEAGTAAAIEQLWADELAIWVSDSRFVLDRLAQKTGFGRLDMTRVGAVGHSFGGAVSMALLGRDPRVRCAVNLDGWTFQGLGTRTFEPVLLVYEGSSAVRHPETGVNGQLDAFDNNAVDTSLQRFGGVRAFVAGTQHLDFTDQTLVSPLQRLTYTGPIRGARARLIVRSLVLGFFDEHLKGAGTAAAFPELSTERFEGSSRGKSR